MLDLILNLICGSRQAPRVVFGIGITEDAIGHRCKRQSHHFHNLREVDIVKDILTEQTTTIRIAAFKDQRGNPAHVDGPPQWATDDSDKVTIEAAPDGMSCKVTTGILAGTPTVTMTADADLGPAVKDIRGSIQFNITTPQAVSVELTVDDPTDVVAPPSP